VDGDARLADIAHDAGVVAVIATVCGEVEGDREALLPGLECLAVEAVRFLRRREAGVLPDRPRPAGIHRRPRSAHEGRKARQRAEMADLREVLLRVERADRDPLRRVPDEVVEAPPPQLARGELLPFRQAVVPLRPIMVAHVDAPQAAAAGRTPAAPPESPNDILPDCPSLPTLERLSSGREEEMMRVLVPILIAAAAFLPGPLAAQQGSQSVIGGEAMPAVVATPEEQPSLDELLWQARPFVVFADSANDPRFRQ